MRSELSLLTGFLVTLFILTSYGCATADQKLASKANYRQSQVSIVEAQERARTDRETARAAESAAMWAALAEVVKADPASSGMIAMVAAVSAAQGDDGPDQGRSMVMLKTENDVTALDWARVLANPITNVGIAAINMDLQKTIARQNTLVDLANAQNDAKMMDTFATLGSRDTTSYTVSDEAFVDLSSTVTTTTSGDTISGDTTTTTDSYNETVTTSDSYNETTTTTSGDTADGSYNDSSDNSTNDSSDNSVTDTVPDEAEEPAP